MAKSKVWQSNLYLILGLFTFLSIARFFDRITRIIPTYDIEGSQYFEILRWFYPFASLFIVTGGLMMFWLMQRKSQQSKWVEILFLIVGLFIVFSYNISKLKILQPLLTKYLFGSSVPLAILLESDFWLTTYLHMAGTLIGVIGLLFLLFPKIKYANISH